MNSGDKSFVLFVGIGAFLILSIACILTYSDYLDNTFSQQAMENGYEQVWDKEGLRVL